MKYLSISLLSGIALNTFAQFNPEKPDLLQGKFYSEIQAREVHAGMAELYHDRQSWEKRAADLRKGIRDGAELSAWKPGKAPKAVIHSRKVMNGYTVENVFFESADGIYVTGNLYKPAQLSSGHAGILCPHGHGNDLRFGEATQQRCATLARMGAIVFAWDMIGMGDSKQCDHKIEKAFKLQLINATRALDFLASLPQVDSKKIGMTGESGGGTQTFMLSAIDNRISVSAPVVMVSGHFFGGCVCESGMAVHKRPGHQTSNVEIAASFAPKPLLLVSDGADWTSNTPEFEFPYIKRIYGFYGAENAVENVHLPDEKHDYGPSKRQAAYRFMAKHLGLNIRKVMKGDLVDESANTVLPRKDLEVFNDRHPRPAGALQGNEAVMDLLNRIK